MSFTTRLPCTVTAVFVACLGLGGSGCQDTVCVGACHNATPKLLRMGFAPGDIDCADPAWREPQSVAACELYFEHRFRVPLVVLITEQQCTDDWDF